MPEQSSVPHGWKMLESPEMLFEESPEFEIEMPEMRKNISLNAPFLQMPVEEFQQPAMHYPAMEYPIAPCGCSPCGCTPVTHCGCGGYHSMQMPAPVNYCNACNQPIQHSPYHMMPYPQHGHNWYGAILSGDDNRWEAREDQG